MRGLPGTELCIEPGELLQQDRQRAAVGDDVVEGQHQHMLLRIEADQAAAHQRTAVQVERLLGVQGDLPLQFGLVASADFEQRRIHPWVNLLQHLPVVENEGGAQHFVTLHQRAQGLRQRLRVELAAQAEGTGQVVGSGLGLHLPEEPQALLRVGRRQRVDGAVPWRDRQQFQGQPLGMHLLLQRTPGVRAQAAETLGQGHHSVRCSTHRACSSSTSSNNASRASTSFSLCSLC
ncbi:hypothetical protein D3C84_376080 [compost metagenome]